MWTILISAGFLALDFGYHLLTRKPPPPAKEIEVPLVAQETPIPYIYGRCRVTAPLLVYTADPINQLLGYSIGDDAAPFYTYKLDMMFVLGIPMQGGLNKIHNMWLGDTLFGQVVFFGQSQLSDLDGNGSYEASNPAGGSRRPDASLSTSIPTPGGASDQGALEYLNGNPAQQLVDPGTGAPTTVAGRYMTTTDWLISGSPDTDQPWNYGVGHTNPLTIPGYRGYLSAFLYNNIGEAHWSLGTKTQVAAYSFEVSSVQTRSIFGPAFDPIGDDCNPVAAIYDLLTGTFGKLGLDPSRIDFASFQSAASALRSEGHGFSMAIDSQQTALDILNLVLGQIDGGIFENPTTGKIQIKLIRADYDPPSVPVIDPTNCVELQNFAALGWTDIPNRVVVTFTNRINDYKPGTAIASSQANAVGQDGEVRTVSLNYPGITSQDLADDVALRELQARSKPTMKCRAIVSRAFLRVLPGDVVKLNWPEANIAGIYFRVLRVGYGTLENPQMMLDLVQDYFYVRRTHPPAPPLGGSDGTFTDSF